ncbi:MAG: hypothetical protein PHE49_07380 [bacterium]|nr:hypothetical protein [bacterium]
MKNKTTLLLIGLLFSALLPATGKTENIGLKIPQMFCFSESFSNYKSSQNTFSITEEISKDETAKPGTGVYIGESFGGLVGGIIGAIPSIFFLCRAFGEACCMEDYASASHFVMLSEISGLICIPIGVSAGTTIMGKRLKQNGSFGKALIGSILGGLGGSVIMLGLNTILQDNVNRGNYGLIGCVIGIPVGSVVGYNF